MIGGQNYTLRGMIQHDGGTDGGHYTYLYHSPTTKGEWVQFSDNSMTYPKGDALTEHLHTGYIYLFEIPGTIDARHKGMENHGNSCWMNAAIQIAAMQMPSTLYLPIKEGADSRNTYLGHAAGLGLQSAFAVKAGMIAPRDALSEAYRITLGYDQQMPSLCPINHWLILDGYFKPWASVRHVHYGAAAALELRKSLPENLNLDAIQLAIYEEATVYCANRDPHTTIQAQFSLTWGVAAMLVLGDLGPEAFSAEALSNQKIRDIESIISVKSDPALGKDGIRSAILNLTIENKSYKAFVDRVIGDPALPMTSNQVIAKFLRYSTPSLGEKAAQDWVTKIVHSF
jgi:2-methylcitrate dehydratase PrpD